MNSYYLFFPLIMLMASLGSVAAEEKTSLPIFIEADRASAIEGQSAEASGRVVVKHDGMTVTSDWGNYQVQEDQLTAGDHVTLLRDGDTLLGSTLNMTVTPRQGELLDPVYTLAGNRARGDAQKLLLDGPDKYIIKQGRFTTCSLQQDDWYLHAKTLDLDYTRKTGQAWNSWLEFKGVPVFYAPWISFPLDRNRKSGFLSPQFSSDKKSGLSIEIPYYWNIAPNYDATFSPNHMSQRGTLLKTEFRYLQPHYQGRLDVQGIQDRITHGGRHSIDFEHQQVLTNRLNLMVNAKKVSDNDYFNDFGDRLAITSTTTLPREGTLSYSGENGSALLRWQRYQTLQTRINPVDSPYDRMPQFYITSSPNWVSGMKTTIHAEVTDFNSASKTNGLRTWAYPSISFPLMRSYGFLTPKIGYHATVYNLKDGQTHQRTQYSRGLPITSLDMGLYFDSETQVKHHVQTLEPRAYYLYIPYENQSKLPLFDSGETDLSFSQLFSENQYSGQDRINDANQLTLALTSRLLHAHTGNERISVTMGQRFYFKDQEVTLTTVGRPADYRRSDSLLSVAAQLWKDLSANYTLQYNMIDHQTRRAGIGLAWRPSDHKRINLRYVKNQISEGIEQYDLSGQWPINRRWYLLGRETYSAKDHRSLERLLGIEHNAGCWAFRAVVQRYVNNDKTYNTRYFLLFELDGIGGIGRNPLEIIQRSISGYNNIYQPAPLR